MRFVDSETQETLDITNAAELLGTYQQHREWLEETLNQQCRGRNGRFVSINTAMTIEDTIFDLLCRHGWVTR